MLRSAGGGIEIENHTINRSSMMNLLMERDSNVRHEACPVCKGRIIGKRFRYRNLTVNEIRISPKLTNGVVPGLLTSAQSLSRAIHLKPVPRIIIYFPCGAEKFGNNKIIPASDYVRGR